MKIICLFIIAVLAIGIQDSFSNPIDSLLVKLTMKNKNPSRNADLVITLKIQSKYNRSILIPTNMSWGLLNDSTGTGYISAQVQRKEGDAYKDIPLGGTIDNMPNMTFDTLTFNKVREESFYIGSIFQSYKGEYRIRILCFASSYNQDVQDAYSNWVYFQCKNDVRRYNIRSSR